MIKKQFVIDTKKCASFYQANFIHLNKTCQTIKQIILFIERIRFAFFNFFLNQNKNLRLHFKFKFCAPL